LGVFYTLFKLSIEDFICVVGIGTEERDGVAFGGLVDGVFVASINGGRGGDGGVFTSDVAIGASVGNVFVAPMEAGRGCDGGMFTSDMEFAVSIKLHSRFSTNSDYKLKSLGFFGLGYIYLSLGLRVETSVLALV